MSKTMVLKPRMSEKTYAQSHAVNTYAFDVPTNANKLEIAKAVSEQFKVSVEDVRIAVIKGKEARSIRIGGARKLVTGKRVDVKKAYVRVKKGESIPIFASIDEAEEKARKAEEKAAKKASPKKSEKKEAETTKSKTVEKKPAKELPKKEEVKKEVVEEEKHRRFGRPRFSFRRKK